jgi:hypothetical protein
MRWYENPWAKVAAVAVGIFVGHQIWRKWGPQHDGQKLAPYDVPGDFGSKAQEFAKQVHAAWDFAMRTGNDEEVEHLYDIWKHENYSTTQLAAPNASGAREEFKRHFGLVKPV